MGVISLKYLMIIFDCLNFYIELLYCIFRWILLKYLMVIFTWTSSHWIEGRVGVISIGSSSSEVRRRLGSSSLEGGSVEDMVDNDRRYSKSGTRWSASTKNMSQTPI